MMQISVLDVDMVEVDLDGVKRTVTREIAEAGLSHAEAFKDHPALGEAAREQIEYFQKCLDAMEIKA